jgi:hypothetical protein
VPTILRSLPYSDRRTTVIVRGQEEEVKPTQIIIWASITEVGQREFDPVIPLGWPGQLACPGREATRDVPLKVKCRRP